MDAEGSEKLVLRLSELVDIPPFDRSARVLLSRTLAITSLDLAAGVRLMCANSIAVGAAALLRSQFEAITRAVWALHCATDDQIERLSKDLSADSQQQNKNMPSVSEMFAQLSKHENLTNLLVCLNEFKGSSWLPLNSFVHAGIHAVHWTKHEPPHSLLETIFKASNGVTILAFQLLGILTGVPSMQREVIAATEEFASCLPARR